MELTGLLQMAPFQGMKEEELVAFLFGLPNSLKHFEPGDIIARQGDLCKGLYILASASDGLESAITNYNHSEQSRCISATFLF